MNMRHQWCHDEMRRQYADAVPFVARALSPDALLITWVDDERRLPRVIDGQLRFNVEIKHEAARDIEFHGMSGAVTEGFLSGLWSAQVTPPQDDAS